MGTGLRLLGGSPLQSDFSTANLPPLLQNFVYTRRVNVKAGRDPVLEFTIPTPKPNFDGIIKSERIARLAIIIHDNDLH